MTNFLKSRALDVIGGIVLPLICLFFDPIVFYNATPYECTWPLLGFFVPPAAGYVAIGLSLGVLAVWLLFGPRLTLGAGFIGGALWASAFCTAMLGLLLLPYTLLSFLLIFQVGPIGVLGFTPWLTAYVFLRNAQAAWAQARTHDVLSRYIPRPIWVVVGLVPIIILATTTYQYLQPWFPNPAPPPAECFTSSVQ